MAPYTQALNQVLNKSLQLPSGSPIKLLSFVEKQGMVLIRTDGREYEKHPSQVLAWVESLQPLGSVAAVAMPGAKLTAPTSLQRMQEALMDSLAKVQASPDYIPQAEQVSKLVQVGINLARVELDAIRMSNR